MILHRGLRNKVKQNNMQRLIPKTKVRDMPFFDGNISFKDKQKFGMICSTGIKNSYRISFAKGQGASRRDETVTKDGKGHTCCGSKVVWRHKTACPRMEGTLPPDFN